MGTFSIMHWLVVLAVVLLLFGGRGKISSIMGDFGKSAGFDRSLKSVRLEPVCEGQCLFAIEPEQLEPSFGRQVVAVEPFA